MKKIENPLNYFSGNSSKLNLENPSSNITSISLIPFWVNFFKKHPTSFLSSTFFHFPLLENDNASKIFFFFTNNPHSYEFFSYFLHNYPSLQSLLTNVFQASVKTSLHSTPSSHRYIDISSISLLPSLPLSTPPPPHSFISYTDLIIQKDEIFCLRFGNSYIIPLAFISMSPSEISMYLESLQVQHPSSHRSLFSTNCTFYLHSFGRDQEFEFPIYSRYEKKVSI
jgi:hypothetical protein